MKKPITLMAVTTALALGLAFPAAAKRDLGGPPAGVGQGGKPAGIACQQAGVSTLQSLGLLAAVAGGGISVVIPGEPEDTVAVLDFETVLSLHRSNPELFQPGGVSVIVGEDVVPATWCADI